MHIKVLIAIAALLEVLAAQELRRLSSPDPVPLGDLIHYELRLVGLLKRGALTDFLPTPATDGPGLRFAFGVPRAEGEDLLVTLSALAEALGRFALPELSYSWNGELRSIQVEETIEITELKPSASGLMLQWRRVEDDAFRVALELTWPAGFFANQAVPLFARPLDLSIAVQIGRLPDALKRAPWTGAMAKDGRRLSFVLEGEEHEGIAFTAAGDGGSLPREGVRIAEWSFPEQNRIGGALSLPPAWVVFSWATEFRDSFFQGREPIDRRVDRVMTKGLDLSLQTEALRVRPEGYRGPVGRFELRALGPEEPLLQGLPFEILVQVRGAGEWPDEPLPPFEVKNTAVLDRESLRPGSDLSDWQPLERIRFLAPSVGPFELPALELSYFDPKAGEILIARTEPRSYPLAGQERQGITILLVALGLLAVLASFVFAKKKKPSAPGAEPGPLDRALKALEAKETTKPEILTAFLAARTGRAPREFEGAALTKTLLESGVAAGLAALVKDAVAADFEARFGGRAAAEHDWAAILAQLDFSLPELPVEPGRSKS